MAVPVDHNKPDLVFPLPLTGYLRDFGQMQL